MEEDLKCNIEDCESNDAIINTRFNVMSIHSYYITGKGVAFPAEIGLTEFTIKVFLSWNTRINLAKMFIVLELFQTRMFHKERKFIAGQIWGLLLPFGRDLSMAQKSHLD